ncbi:hypothetical protein BJ944DRAFT_172392, partial [Cunninghamella echinulata]
MALPIDEFVLDGYVRSQWIAFFTLWILWGLVYAIRFIFQTDRPGPGPGPAPAADTTVETGGNAAAGASVKKTFVYHGGLRGRLDNAHRVLFENTLLLLSVLVLNTVASGSTRAVYILTWIYFAFTVVYAFTEIGLEHRFIRFIFSLVFFGVTLAIGGLAFSHGFY